MTIGSGLKWIRLGIGGASLELDAATGSVAVSGSTFRRPEMIGASASAGALLICIELMQ
jgi:hypothetical protein